MARILMVATKKNLVWYKTILAVCTFIRLLTCPDWKQQIILKLYFEMT